MQANRAFIYISIFAYFACIIETLLGTPVIMNVSVWEQVLAYIILIILLTAYLKSSYSKHTLGAILGALYGLGAMMAFSDFVLWAPNSIVSGPAMAAWDLVLAVAILTF